MYVLTIPTLSAGLSPEETVKSRSVTTRSSPISERGVSISVRVDVTNSICRFISRGNCEVTKCDNTFESHNERGVSISVRVDVTNSSCGLSPEETVKSRSVTTRSFPISEHEETVKSRSVTTRSSPISEQDVSYLYVLTLPTLSAGLSPEETVKSWSVTTRSSPISEREETVKSRSVTTRSSPISEQDVSYLYVLTLPTLSAGLSPEETVKSWSVTTSSSPISERGVSISVRVDVTNSICRFITRGNCEVTECDNTFESYQCARCAVCVRVDVTNSICRFITRENCKVLEFDNTFVPYHEQDVSYLYVLTLPTLSAGLSPEETVKSWSVTTRSSPISERGVSISVRVDVTNSICRFITRGNCEVKECDDTFGSHQ
ncbi:hypothetical protein J6590_074139 [Homalodisca vitripennis]|nr:hypothetical protein J6590_074139 [Homalodisca vitripennis]